MVIKCHGLIDMKNSYRIIACMLLAATLSSCGKDEAHEAVPKAEQVHTKLVPKVINITTVKPVSVQINETVIATGTLGPKQTSNIGPLVPGVITRIYAKVGDRVEKGDPLFQTRKDDYQRKVDEAQAGLNVAKAKFANAEQNFNRTQQLVDKGFSPRSKLDAEQATLDVARAEIQMRSATLRTAEQSLKDTTVRAPFNAAVTARYNDEGVFMTSSFRTGPESGVLQLQENHVVVAVVRAPEKALADLHVGQKALITIAGQEEPRATTIYAVNDMVDIATRTVEVRMGLDNKDYSIKSGQFARAEIFVGTKQALSLPKSTVKTDANGSYVYIYSSGTAVKTPVETQDLHADDIAIMSGLSDLDTVIAENTLAIHDGASVKLGDVQ